MSTFGAVVRKNLLLAVALFALLLPGTVMADQILTFEGFADLTVLTNQYPGINFQGSTILTAGGSLNSIDFPPHSGVNVIYNPVGPMELVFSTPISYFSGFVTYNSGMTMQGFDAANNLLATATGAYGNNYVSSGNPPNELLTITAANITKVVLTGGSGNNFTLDDAQFSGSIDINNPVPEPSTFVLLGAGIAAAAMLRRRMRK